MICTCRALLILLLVRLWAVAQCGAAAGRQAGNAAQVVMLCCGLDDTALA